MLYLMQLLLSIKKYKIVGPNWQFNTIYVLVHFLCSFQVIWPCEPGGGLMSFKETAAEKSVFSKWSFHLIIFFILYICYSAYMIYLYICAYGSCGAL